MRIHIEFEKKTKKFKLVVSEMKNERDEKKEDMFKQKKNQSISESFSKKHYYRIECLT